MTFIIAEIGVNHEGSWRSAMEMIHAAKSCGADAVKFQMFDPVRLARQHGEYRDLLTRTRLNWDEMLSLKRVCGAVGVEFLCTPFHGDYVQPLVDMGVKRIKIGSGQAKPGEIVDAVAKTDLPVIMSNGLSTDDEFYAAFKTLRWRSDGHDHRDITALYCVSAYPAPLHRVDLRGMIDLVGLDDNGVRVGFSDHTIGPQAAILAAAMGAECIEAHFTLDKSLPGPDHVASKTPDEFAEMVRGIRACQTS